MKPVFVLALLAAVAAAPLATAEPLDYDCPDEYPPTVESACETVTELLGIDGCSARSGDARRVCA